MATSNRPLPFFVLLVAASATLLPVVAIRSTLASSPPPTDPWTPKQTISAAEFAKELRQLDPSLKIVYVGVRTLYNGAHIPGATFHGPASNEQGIADLQKFAADLPKNSKILIYCGCCPLDRCPNLRPAFTILRDQGFSHVRVLVLPTSFAEDWVEKGYPVEKGS